MLSSLLGHLQICDLVCLGHDFFLNYFSYLHFILQSLEKTQNKEFKLTLESRHVAAILELCKVIIPMYLFDFQATGKVADAVYLPVHDASFIYNQEQIFNISVCIQFNPLESVFEQILALVLNFSDSQDKEDSGYGIWKEMWRCQYSGVTKIGTCVSILEPFDRSLQLTSIS